MTCTEGIYIDGRRIEAGDCSGPRARGHRPAEPARSRRPCWRRPAAASSARARLRPLRRGRRHQHRRGRPPRPRRHRHARGAGPGQADARRRRSLPDGRRRAQRRRPAGGGDGRALPRQRSIFFARDGSHPVIVAHRAAGAAGSPSSATGTSSWPRGTEEIPLVAAGAACR